ncbi:MAG: ribonuclease E/G [Pseudomonadota bacterium]
MKGRSIVLNAAPRHAALVVDGVVEDLLLEPPDTHRTPMPGEIWPARLDRQVLGAAFLDLGQGHEGYLRDVRGVKGQSSMVVQVSSVAEPGKAIPVDRRLLIKGRNLILTPGAPGVNVSRRIRDPEERDRLVAALPDPGDACGIIVRSAAREVPEAVLLAEYRGLQERYTQFETLTDPIERHAPWTYALREWSDPLPDIIAVTDASAREAASDPVLLVDEDLMDCLEPDDGDPFDYFGIWDEIERLKSPRVNLPSGGWMAIETTRAMVTVDVNTGDQFSGGAGMTANVEAARELPRQLRLRGLGGQVIIDFAPMKKQHRKKIDETLKSAFRKDSIETSLAGWTPLGNFELQRKRERRPFTESL